MERLAVSCVRGGRSWLADPQPTPNQAYRLLGRFHHTLRRNLSLQPCAATSEAVGQPLGVRGLNRIACFRTRRSERHQQQVPPQNKRYGGISVIYSAGSQYPPNATITSIFPQSEH